MAVTKLKVSEILRNIRNACEENITNGYASNLNQWIQTYAFSALSEVDEHEGKNLTKVLQKPLEEMGKYYKEQDSILLKKKEAFETFNDLFADTDTEDEEFIFTLKADYQSVVEDVLRRGDINRLFLKEHLLKSYEFYRILFLEIVLPLYRAERNNKNIKILQINLRNSFREIFTRDSVELRSLNSRQVKTELLYAWNDIFTLFKSCSVLSYFSNLLHLSEKFCHELRLHVNDNEIFPFTVEFEESLPFNEMIEEISLKEKGVLYM